MNLEINICDLGTLLKKIETKYSLEIMTKVKLNGGWMTMNGEARIDSIPINGIMLNGNKPNNIIVITVINNNSNGSTIKITGHNKSKFSISIDAGKYRELHPNSVLNEVKVNNNECKLRIDENIIFKINCNVKEIEDMVKS